MNPKSGKAGSPVSPLAPKEPQDADTAKPGESVKPATATQTKPFKKSQSAGKTSWIEVEMVDEAGQPVSGQRYQITLPDGSVAEGSLDEKGLARIEGIDPGSCKICFPDLDKDAWEPA